MSKTGDYKYSKPEGIGKDKNVPNLRDAYPSDVIACFVADLHLTPEPPIARSAEVNWLGVMEDYLKQLKEVAKKHECPIFYAGDIFDTANPPIWFVNWVVEHLPRGHAIPGNHDLPHHRYVDRDRSAYWTLKLAGTIKDLDPYHPTQYERGLIVWSYPYSFSLRQVPAEITRYAHDKVHINVALVHSYCWIIKHGRVGAKDEERLSSYRDKLHFYDCAVFGDNHSGFLVGGSGNKVPVLNCGTFMCRRTDERDYTPTIGLLHSDKRISRVPIDTSKDSWVDLEKCAETLERVFDISDFVSLLTHQGNVKLDFEEAVKVILEKEGIRGRTRRKVLQALVDRKKER